MSTNNRNTVAEWVAIAHWCEMEAEEKGVAGPKTKAAELAFWAVRNPEVLVPVEVALTALEPVDNLVTPVGRKPQALTTAPLPVKVTRPAKMVMTEMPVKKLSFGTNNARARMAATQAKCKIIAPRINYTGVEDWADEKGYVDVTRYDEDF
jgi:hypothetical protein